MEIKLTILSLLIGTIIGLSHLSEDCHVDWPLVSRSWRSLIRRGAMRPALRAPPFGHIQEGLTDGIGPPTLSTSNETT
jgi:hypothetical protein